MHKFSGSNLNVVTDIRTMVLSQEDTEVLRWLRLNDTSANHNLARSKHVPSTGNWFLESDGFTKWSNASMSSIWLYGKPGSGKTILCSSIIEQVEQLYQSTPDQYGYFYFDFNQSWNVVDMLRSIVAQLCTRKKTVPSELRHLYQQCTGNQRQPTQDILLKILLSLLTTSHRTFIILDALDECPLGKERNHLLNTLQQMLNSSPLHLNILVTSRKENEIEKKLTPLIDNTVPLEDSVIDLDIILYIRTCIKTDDQLQEWEDDIKKDIEKALCEKVQGMYDVLDYFANGKIGSDG